MTIKEYDGGLHTFIDSINPEFREAVITDEDSAALLAGRQQELALGAEADIHQWLLTQYSN